MECITTSKLQELMIRAKPLTPHKQKPSTFNNALIGKSFLSMLFFVKNLPIFFLFQIQFCTIFGIIQNIPFHTMMNF